MNSEKIEFIKNKFSKLLATLPADARGKWGLMNAQQMVEHMTNTIRITNGKEFQGIELPEERVVKVREFFLSEKPFRENTTNHLLPDVPPAVRNAGMKEAIAEFDQEIAEFFRTFEEDKNRKTINPFAGTFNFDQWIQLLYKHAVHHAKQFGLPVADLR